MDSSSQITPHVIRGRILMLLSTLAFAGMGLVTKLLPPAVGSAEKVFFRSLTGMIILPIAFFAAGRPMGRPVNKLGLMARGLFGALSLMCFFYAIDKAGLVKATLYCYTYPIFAVIFAWVDLGEKPNRIVMFALVTALAGTLLTLDLKNWRPAFSIGDIAGLTAGLCSGAAITSVRKLRQTDSSVWIVLSFAAISCILALPFTVRNFTQPAGGVLGGLLLLGLLGTTAQILMTSGYGYITAVEGSILSLMVVPLSAILAMAYLGDKLSLRFWIGAAIVFCSAVAASVQTAPPNQED